MLGIWRKCLGLTASLLAVSAQAAGLEPIAATPSSDVIARSGGQQTAIPSPPPGRAASIERPVIAGSASPMVPESRPVAVSLERPRPADFAVQRVAFQTSPRPLVRAQAAETAPAPKPTPAFNPSDYPMVPPSLGVEGSMGFDGGIMTPGGINPDRYGVGDGVTHQFNNFLTFETEYLFWHMRGERTPPLVTTGLAAPPPFALGALVVPTSQVLFGGGSDDTGWHSGTRERFTLWFDRDHAIGLEGSYFFLSQQSTNFAAASDGSTVLAIPFIGANGASSSAVLGGDGRTRGGVMASLTNRLWGAEANIRSNWLTGPCAHLDLLAGFRALGLDDSFDLAANRTFTTGALPITQNARDSFATRNRFYGGQVGAEGEWRSGRWSFGATTKVALGSTNQKVEISGGGSVNGIPTSGGIFTSSTNINQFHRDHFSVVPEVGVKVGYQFTDYLRANVGYNFLYWSDVVRATEQIDPVLAGAGRPAFAFKSSDFWTHGVTVGLEFRY